MILSLLWGEAEAVATRAARAARATKTIRNLDMAGREVVLSVGASKGGCYCLKNFSPALLYPPLS